MFQKALLKQRDSSLLVFEEKKKKKKILNKEKKKDPIIYFCRYIAMNQYFLISQRNHLFT